jgi:hypothetical protein
MKDAAKLEGTLDQNVKRFEPDHVRLLPPSFVLVDVRGSDLISEFQQSRSLGNQRQRLPAQAFDFSNTVAEQRKQVLV